MIKTIRLRDLFKYLVGLISIILICVCSTRYFSNLNDNSISSFFNIDYASIIKSNIAIASLKEDGKVIAQQEGKYTSRSGVTRILDMELPNIEGNTNTEIADVEDNTTQADDQDEIEREEGELKESYTNKYGTVKIKNDTDIKLTESILKPDYNVKNSKNIIIYHTHTCESYTPTKENTYKASGNFRTIDLEHSVVRVGKELESCLKKYEFNVVRNETKHDYPAYSGSYERSLKTVQSLLKKNDEAEIVFDVHRDAIGSSSNFAPTVEINGEKVAQLMFVIGTNEGRRQAPKLEKQFKICSKSTRKSK